MNEFGIDERLYRDFISFSSFNFDEIVDIKQINECTLKVELNDGVYIYDNFIRLSRKLPSNYKNMTDNEMVDDFMYCFNSVRKRRGYTLADISNMTGIPTSTLSRYANGESAPTLINIRKIVKAINCKLEDLIIQYD